MAWGTGKAARSLAWRAKSIVRSDLRKKQSDERRVSHLLFHSKYHAGFYAHVVFHFEGTVNFFAEFVEIRAGGVCDVSIFQHPRTRQVDGKFALDAAGTESEQRHAITEANRFANVVRDKDDGTSSFEPDAFEFVV